VAQFIATTLGSSTPVILAALAGVFAYRSGIAHLGLEGLMLLGAFVGVAVAERTGSVALAAPAAVAATVAASALFWLVIGPLGANQYIAGLGLTLLGAGGTTFALEAMYGSRGTISSDHGLPQPVHGVTDGALSALSELSIVVWITPLLIVGSWIVLRRTRYGLRLAAAGEFPFAVKAGNGRPWRIRLGSLLIGGAFCGFAGLELALGGLTIFSPNMTSGRGYIAFVAVVFGAAHPLGAAAAGLFFGFVDALGIQSQLEFGDAVPGEAILALPFVLTIVAVVVSGRLRKADVDAAAGFSELRDA
jgi:simple sugar transport system permease protein